MVIKLKSMSVKDVHHGNAADDRKNDPPVETAGFTAQVITLNHLDPIRVSYTRFDSAGSQCWQGPLSFWYKVEYGLEILNSMIIQVPGTCQGLSLSELGMMAQQPKSSHFRH